VVSARQTSTQHRSNGLIRPPIEKRGIDEEKTAPQFIRIYESQRADCRLPIVEPCFNQFNTQCYDNVSSGLVRHQSVLLAIAAIDSFWKKTTKNDFRFSES